MLAICTGPAFMEFKVGNECFCLLLSSERTLLLLHTHAHTLTQPPKQTNKNPQIFPLFAALLKLLEGHFLHLQNKSKNT